MVLFLLRKGQKQDNAMEIAIGITGFVAFVLAYRMLVSDRSEDRESNSHCHSIKNIKYTMMDNEK